MSTTLQRPELSPVVNFYPNYKVLLHNDDVNSFDHVVKALCKVMTFTKEVAMGFAIEAHNNGIALVKICTMEHAEYYVQGLTDEGLTATMEVE